jgi:predicted permease
VAVAVFLTTFVLVGAGLLIGVRLAGRRGSASPRQWDRRTRRIVVLMALVYAAVLAVITTAFATGHPGLAIGAMVAICILPAFITTPLRIRRANREAAEARAKREAGSS